MDVDWAADVKKHVPDADDGAIAGIIRFCGIALQNRDSSLVSFSDPAETGRVRESFLKRKLGLTLPDAELDEAIAAVGKRMAGVSFRNRVTVYYLLAEHFARLQLFDRGSSTAGVVPGTDPAADPAGPPLAGAAVAGAAGAAVVAAQDAVSGVAATARQAGSTVTEAITGGAAAAAAGVSALAAQAAGAGGEARDAALGAVAGAGAAVAAAGQGAANAAADLAGGVKGAVGAGMGSAQRVLDNLTEEGPRRRWGWLPWLLLGLLLVALLLWLFGCQARPGQAPAAGAEAAGVAGQDGGQPDAAGTGGAGPAAAAAPSVSVPAVAPAAGPAVAASATPAAAAAELASRVATETRDGKPLVKVFFRPGSAWVVPAFAPAAGTLKAYLAEHAGSSLAVSGFADKTGNAEVNAAISRERASRVKAALVAAGIPESSVNLVKPAAAVDGSSADGAARRVEVTVQ